MKDVQGFEGRYAVTSCGKVWSYLTGKFLAPKMVNGYHHVDLFDADHKMHQCLVHRLIAQAYLPNKEGLPCINHKNEVRTDNCVGNLEWCDYSYNNGYNGRAKKAAERRSPQGQKNITAALVAARSKAVICEETGARYASSAEAGRQVGVKGSCINRVCRGGRKTAGGFHWRFENVIKGVRA